MMQEFRGIQNRHGGLMEENERTVAAQVIGSEARNALRGQRSHVLHEHHVLLQVGDRNKGVREKADALGTAVAQCKLSTILRSSTKATYTKLGMPGGTGESLVDDDVSEGKFPRNLRTCEASCCQSTTVSDFSSKRDVAGNSSLSFLEHRGNKTYQGGGGAKHEEDSWGGTPSHYSSAHLPPSGIECSQPLTLTEKLIHLFSRTRKRQSVGTYSIDLY